MALSKILPASQEQYVGARNLIINGAMTVSQRNGATAITPTGYNNFIVDRFSATNSDAANKMSFQQVTDAPDGFYNSIKATTTTAVASLGATERYYIQTVLEGNTVTNTDWGKSSAKTCTFSFWAKSSLTGNFPFSINTPSGTPCYNSTYNISVPNTWEYQTITVEGPTTGTWNLGTNSASLYIVWGLGSGSTYSTSTTDTWQGTFYEFVDGAVAVVSTLNATLQITGVQLEVGEATPFEHRSYGDELARCMRYYYSIQGATGQAPEYFGYSYAGTSHVIFVPFLTQMRASPSLSTAGTMNGYNGSNVLDTSVNIESNVSCRDSASIIVRNFTATVGTPSRLALGTTGQLNFNAEL